MHTFNQESISERLTKLETQIRRQKNSRIRNFMIIVGLIGVIVLQHFGLDITKGKTVSAERFLLKDSQGHIRAELKSDDLVTGFALFDQSGTHRAAFSIVDGEPGVHLYNESGFRQAVVGSTEEGPRIVFMNPYDLQHAGMALSNNGTLGVYQGQGKNQNPLISLKQLEETNNYLDKEIF